jgi:tetratricopeptide (TPR) repeat protein
MTIRSARCSDVRTGCRTAAIALAALAALAVPSRVAADAKAEAQVLFDQALVLFKEGKYAQACGVLEASVEKFPGLGARGKLAECYEKIDKLAKAWALYREVAAAAKRENDAKREKVAQQRADALLPRVPKLTIVVPPAAQRADLAITRDGRPVSAAELGLPIYVDAGTYTIKATATGMTAFTSDVELIDGQALTVEIPVLKPAIATDLEPARPADEPIVPGSKRAKELAQSLVTEGVALLERKDYQPALDRFAAAYELYPTPKLLLNMAATLRDMGRLADSADMYQAFIEAPDTNPELVGEAKQILNNLDDQLYLLNVRVTPRGADVSIDGGPWISVGDKRLMARLNPGLHMVRSRRTGHEVYERTINAFEGEKNDLDIVLQNQVAAPEPPPIVTIDGGTQEREDPFADQAIAAPASKDGQVVIPVLAKGTRAERGGVQYRSTAVLRDDNDDIVQVLPPPERRPRELGLTAQLRIDGGGGGAALAFGISFSPRSFRNLELDLTGMVSKPTPPDESMAAQRIYGVFVGARYRFLTGQIRPTLGVGMPVFLSDDLPRVGVRGAAGAELVINGHLAVVGEVGYEHFFNTQAGYDANVLVPLVQITGRL